MGGALSMAMDCYIVGLLYCWVCFHYGAGRQAQLRMGKREACREGIVMTMMMMMNSRGMHGNGMAAAV
jgi:hypothetical protein